MPAGFLFDRAMVASILTENEDGTDPLVQILRVPTHENGGMAHTRYFFTAGQFEFWQNHHDAIFRDQ